MLNWSFLSCPNTCTHCTASALQRLFLSVRMKRQLRLIFLGNCTKAPARHQVALYCGHSLSSPINSLRAEQHIAMTWTKLQLPIGAKCSRNNSSGRTGGEERREKNQNEVSAIQALNCHHRQHFCHHQLPPHHYDHHPLSSLKPSSDIVARLLVLRLWQLLHSSHLLAQG